VVGVRRKEKSKSTWGVGGGNNDFFNAVSSEGLWLQKGSMGEEVFLPFQGTTARNKSISKRKRCWEKKRNARWLNVDISDCSRNQVGKDSDQVRERNSISRQNED